MVKKEIKVEVIYTPGYRERYTKACAETAKKRKKPLKNIGG